ncbi:hypothetical protein PINS_up021344 [Pythium insidiosum]|nr:hypothetical protein PINS_up021344 [Pythium insidiosum]
MRLPWLISTRGLLRARAFSTASAKKALSPDEFRSFPLVRVQDVGANTKRLLFALPTPEHVMGLPVASCLVAKATIAGEDVVRPYTPVNLDSDRGVLELIVKGYPTGLLSKHLVNLREGDTLEMKGPFVKFPYQANQFKRVAFIAGGSGITPCLQVIKEIVRVPQDTTQVDLIFANNTAADILLREELDALTRAHVNVRIHYVLATPPADGSWKGHTGFVTKALLKELLPPPSRDHFIGVCGPPGMMAAVSGDKNPDRSQGKLTGFLKDLSHAPQQVFKF